MYPIQNNVQISIGNCSQLNFPFFLMFCLGCCDFLANITVMLALGLNA